MNVIERMESIGAEKKISDFRVKQQLPYAEKYAIEAAYRYMTI